MAELNFTGDQARAFRSCVEVGVDGLDGPAGDAVLALAARAREGEPLLVPDAVQQDLQSAFVVGLEGLEGSDPLFPLAWEVGGQFNLSGMAPVP